MEGATMARLVICVLQDRLGEHPAGQDVRRFDRHKIINGHRLATIAADQPIGLPQPRLV